MFEIGIDTTGHNPHHGTPRNPYGVDRYPGGSSSGSAAAVAQGLCPLALGADGGGSIRIPAALCGVVGLKPTFGRVSEHGAAPLCWSVAHVGPIGATVSDVAVGYAAIAGPDPRDPNSLLQPAPLLGALDDLDLRGLRLGVFTPWLEHADQEVVACVRRALESLTAAGATLVELDLPDLEHARLSHAVTILTEMATAMDPHLAEHRTDFGLSVRLNLAMARGLTSRDYVRAQQGRTRATRTFERVLTEVHAVVTPTTACTAPVLRPDAVAQGESDLDVTSRLMRFVFPSNLTGHPALSVPCGYDAQGLPVGLQFIGRAWDELTLLRLGLQVERRTERREPAVHARLLPR
jgi:Asp-tRNA(Asn)/Glu-tRNA(Gln) amidotransferase A subunit family amidase